MKKAATDADFVAGAVAPQAEIISSLAQSSSMAQRAIRGYSLLGGAAELAEARNYNTVAETALQAARKLSDAQPRPTLLSEKSVPPKQPSETFSSKWRRPIPT